ncbi:hypothetical protein Lal_00043060 [Lupinus albus]|nr:hypothetical protein Lal_00043060 [Lupinus albus]
MSSCSRTKKPRTSGSQSKQGGSYSKSSPLNMTRLLTNDDQRKVFEEHFHGRTIFTPKYGKIFSLPMLREKISFWIPKPLVHCAMTYRCKEELEQRKRQGFNETVKNKDILSTGYLKLEERLLHYFMSYVILPKFPIDMIMDELVSLRGYITTRMDALDTHNQQIQYELHRLSSRLNSMDVDEDSSELES